MTTKINDLVRIEETGEVTTIEALDLEGRITYRMTDKFYTRRGGPFTKYFADVDYVAGSPSTGWEISKLAYLSRTGQKVQL
jgi:hypothetical protein